MFGFKRQKVDSDHIDSLALEYSKVRDELRVLADVCATLEGRIQRNKMEIDWQDEKLKSALRMISILEELSDYDVEHISNYTFGLTKKERKEELIKQGYVYFACIDGDEIWKKRKV